MLSAGFGYTPSTIRIAINGTTHDELAGPKIANPLGARR